MGRTYIDSIRWSPDFERWEVGCYAAIAGDAPAGIQIKVKLSIGNTVLANDTYEVFNGEIGCRISLSDPGIDDYRNELLWSPEKPTLMDAHIELWYKNQLLDEARSYTAMRTVGIQRDRFMFKGWHWEIHTFRKLERSRDKLHQEWFRVSTNSKLLLLFRVHENATRLVRLKAHQNKQIESDLHTNHNL